MLEKEGVGARSGIRPFSGLANSQKYWNERYCNSFRNSSRHSCACTAPIAKKGNSSNDKIRDSRPSGPTFLIAVSYLARTSRNQTGLAIVTVVVVVAEY